MSDAARTGRAPPGRRSRWRWLLRLLLPIGVVLFGVLLFNVVQQLDWADIRRALLAFSTAQVATAMLLTALTYLTASGYELLSRRHEAIPLPPHRCMAIGFVAYTIAANLSSLLGNAGARYRLYAKHGIGFRHATRITLFSVSTNWSGFVLLAGLTFAFAPPDLPARWPLEETALRLVGAGLLIASSIYLFTCYRRGGHRFQLRGIRFTLPGLPLAALQCSLSALVWLGIASVITAFLPSKVHLLEVLPVIFLSTVAGLVIRLPAGVGVTEFVFVAVLGPALGTSAVIAALLAYRAVFQLLPLLLASTLYLILELQGRRTAFAAGGQKPELKAAA